MERRVVVFTSPSCTTCHAATSYLRRRGIPFEERNIGEDSGAAEDFARLGYAATPLILVGDELVVGFNRTRLDAVLQAAGLDQAGAGRS